MKKVFSVIVVFFCFSLFAHAQTTVTFNVNLQPLMKDSVFVPGRDRIQVTGNLYPLGKGRSQKMYDQEPIDSVFTTEVKFSSRLNDEELIFNFEIITPEKLITEDAPRPLRLHGNEIEIPPLYFNDFAM